MEPLFPIRSYSFHTIKRIDSHTAQLYIGDTWKPDRDISIIGATLGLLIFTNNASELYLSISKDPSLEPADYFACLKKGFMFYAQRDQRSPPRGITDLIKDIWLPSGTGFLVLKDEPVYFKCGAMNKSGRRLAYDILATLYYIEIVGSESVPLPRVEPETLC